MEYEPTTKIAKTEVDENSRPKLKEMVSNMDDYDIIFIGYPIWWHTAPMAVYTFLESYDFSGKTVIPFCTSGGCDLEESMLAIESPVPNSKISDGITANVRSDVKPWLRRIGMLK